VPGNLLGLLHVHERLGRLPLRVVVEPAIGLAREGVRQNAHQGYFLGLLRPIVTASAAGRTLFAPTGELLEEGDVFRNPELAAFLESLPDGARDFYHGALAERIASDMQEGQGLLTRADLAAYRVVEREPLAAPYRSLVLLTNPPPSFGGSLLAISLALLAASPPAAEGSRSAQQLATLAEVMIEVDRLREAGVLVPEDVPPQAANGLARRLRRFSRGTTHLSVCDSEGSAASMTTSNGEGSGAFVAGTGIMLNNMLGEDDLHPEGFHASPPGGRVSSMMSPSLLLEGDRVRVVLGSGGSKRIRTALLQVVSAVADHGLPIQQAVEHPRIHWDGECLQVEPGLPEAAIAALRSRLALNEWDRLNVYFGGVHAVVPGEGGAGDPRRGGAVAFA